MALAACATMRGLLALRQVDFEVDRVATVRLAGVPLERIRSASDVSLQDAARIGAAVLRRQVPLTFDVHLLGRNPAENRTTARLVRMQWTLDLNGREVFVGTRSAESTLRRLGTQQLKLPAVVALTPDTQSLVAGQAHYRLTGSMYYVTPGRLAETLFDSGVHTPSIGFTFEGDIDLSRASFTAPASAGAPDNAAK